MPDQFTRPEFFYFDLGNVIYFFDYARGASRASLATGVDEAKLRAAVYDFGLEELYESGVIGSQRLVNEVARVVGKSIPADAFLDAISAMFTFNQDIIPLIDLLQSKGIPIGILSNTCPAHWDWIIAQQDLDFAHLFQQIVLSYDVGRMKPYPEIYQRSEERAGVAPEKIFFIDDRAVNVHAARERGWQAMLFTDVNGVLEQVRQW